LSTANIDGPAVSLERVARRFGRRWVLRGVDLRVERGVVLGVTGRNGSGKTTLLRICSTALRPTRGTGSIFGHDLTDEAAEIRPFVGILAHQAGLYDDLTAHENLSFSLRMAGLATDDRAIDGALERAGLLAERTSRVRAFSAGMRRRLSLARLFLRPPRLLLLDEPYASFDTDGIDAVNAFVREIAHAGGTALVATHDVRRGRAVLDRIVHIEDGLAAPGAAPGAHAFEEAE
jgi:heme ABC exporter ATP-binding subunit CcmA